jgi:hypothetical protein
LEITAGEVSGRMEQPKFRGIGPEGGGGGHGVERNGLGLVKPEGGIRAGGNQTGL